MACLGQDVCHFIVACSDYHDGRPREMAKRVPAEFAQPSLKGLLKPV